MKSTLLKSLALASILVFAVGCGKDKKKSSSGIGYYNPYNTNNPYYQNPQVSAQTAIANLTSWYNSAGEVNASIGPRTEKRVRLTYSASSCNTKTFLGFIDINVCKQGSSTTTPLSTKEVYLAPAIVKSSNAKLAAVFTPPAGSTLANATETNSPMGIGRLFEVTYVKTNGHIVQYLVDTGLNSVVNPVQIYDSELKTGEVVSNPQELR